MSEVDVNQLLSQMRTLAAQAQGGGGSAAVSAQVDEAPANFQSLLRQSIDQVNQTQQQATQMSDAFAAGEPGTDLAEVMIALQKASVSFQAMTEVRNHLVDAYKDIKNMPV